MGSGQVLALPVDAMPDNGGDRLAALFDAHEERLYRLARRLTRSADAADDLVQDTFLRAAKSLRSIPEGQAKEEAWLVRVLVNVRRDEWRRAGVKQRFAAVVGTVEVAGDASPESALIAKRAVWGALETLAPRRRAIVVMTELEGMNPAAIASLLGISVMTVRWHISMG